MILDPAFRGWILIMLDLGWMIIFSVFFAASISLKSDMVRLSFVEPLSQSGPNLFVGTTERRCQDTSGPIIFSCVRHWAVGILGSNIIRRRAYTRKRLTDKIFNRLQTWLRARKSWFMMTLRDCVGIQQFQIRKKQICVYNCLIVGRLHRKLTFESLSKSPQKEIAIPPVVLVQPLVDHKIYPQTDYDYAFEEYHISP